MELVRRMAREAGVSLVWVGEAGSRAWGLAGPASDHDLRFLFVRNRHDVASEGATLEGREGNYEAVGWDLRKAVSLTSTGSAVLAEWLSLPAPLFEADAALMRSWRALVLAGVPASPAHYLGQARAERKRHLGGRKTVVAKEYLHVVWPALMGRAWASRPERFPETMEFDALLATAAPELPEQGRVFLSDLARRKRSGELRAGEESSHCRAVDEWLDTVESAPLPRWPGLSPDCALRMSRLVARTRDTVLPPVKEVRVAIMLASDYKDDFGRSYAELCFEAMTMANEDASVILRGPAVYDSTKGEMPPPDSFDLLVLPGSGSAAYEEKEWIHSMSGYVKNVVEEERVPVIAVCFGEQLVAHACGGSTAVNEKGKEFGCQLIELTEQGKALLPSLPAAPRVLMAHGDTVVTLPPGATLLATNEKGVQMFSYKKAICVQGHPEFYEQTGCDCIDEEKERHEEERQSIVKFGRGDGPAIFKAMLEHSIKQL